MAHVRSLSVERSGELIELPPATHRNLELTQTLRGENAPTLLSLLDSCRTGMGSRLLRQWLTRPQRERRAARERQQGVAALIDAGFDALREALRGVSDVERSTARVALRQARPRELAGLRATLAALPALVRTVPGAGDDADAVVTSDADAGTGTQADELPLLPRLLSALHSPADLSLPLLAIAQEPSVLLREGGVIAAGFDAELDELRGMAANCDAYR